MIFFVIIVSIAILTSKSKKQQGGLVLACHDGDTCNIVIGKEAKPVRFAGIDCPELDQRSGKKARDFTLRLIQGKEVQLKCGGKSHEREVCTIYLNGVNINEQIVKAGWAYDSPTYSHGKYKTFQEEARRLRIGLWAEENLTSPHCYRHSDDSRCKDNPNFMP